MKKLSVSFHKQSGAALLVSLVILMILSVIGISAVRGGLLQSLMSANAQQDVSTFRSADAGAAAIYQIIAQDKISDNGFSNMVMSAGIGQVVRYIQSDGTPTEAETYLDGAISFAKVETRTEYLNPIQSFCYADAGSMKIDSNTQIACNVFRIRSVANLADQGGEATTFVTVLGAGGSGPGS